MKREKGACVTKTGKMRLNIYIKNGSGSAVILYIQGGCRKIAQTVICFWQRNHLMDLFKDYLIIGIL